MKLTDAQFVFLGNDEQCRPEGREAASWQRTANAMEKKGLITLHEEWSEEYGRRMIASPTHLGDELYYEREREEIGDG